MTVLDRDLLARGENPSKIASYIAGQYRQNNRESSKELSRGKISLKIGQNYPPEVDQKHINAREHRLYCYIIGTQCGQKAM